MFSALQNEQFDEDSGITCFLCSRSSDKENLEADSGRRKERRIPRRNNNNKSIKVDFEQCSSSTNPQTQNAARRTLLKYLVGRCGDEQLKVNLTSFNSPIKFCNECQGLAKEVQDLHLQLERIQMMLIDKLKKLKELIVQNSNTFREWSEGRSVRKKEHDKDGEELARLIQLACQFRTFVGNDDTNQVDVPLVFLEKFVGSKTFPEIVSSTSKPNQAKQMETKHISDCQPKTEYIPEQIQEAGDSSGSTVPEKTPQSKPLLRGEYLAQGKEELDMDTNAAGDEIEDDGSDVDFDPVNFQSNSEESTSPPELSPTRKDGNNSHTATSDETRVRCGSCGSWYSSFSKLISHSRLRHRGKKLSCAMCASSDETKAKLYYSLRDELPRHLDDIHGVSSLRLECDFPPCSQRFYYLYDFQRHNKICHSETDKGKPLLKCNSCSESFRSAYSFSSHQMRVHGHAKLKCELCPPSPGRYFSTLSALKNHLLYSQLHLKKDAENFPCSKCPKVFAQKSSRNQHEKTSHGEKKFSCDKCDYATSWKARLERHSRTVHASTSSICEICGFASNNDASLRGHYLRMHDPEYQLQYKARSAVKKFECSECPKKFATRNQIKNHMLTHSGETPFYCDLCRQAFKQKGSLKEHMLSLHGGGDANAKLHKCPQCSKSFLFTTRLRRHMSSHTTEMLHCDLCGKPLKEKWSLKSHMMSVHGIGATVKKETRRKWVCEECGKDFHNSSNLKRHLLGHAKGERIRETK